jgi:hypothetical protein
VTVNQLRFSILWPAVVLTPLVSIHDVCSAMVGIHRFSATPRVVLLTYWVLCEVANAKPDVTMIVCA